MFVLCFLNIFLIVLLSFQGEHVGDKICCRVLMTTFLFFVPWFQIGFRSEYSRKSCYQLYGPQTRLDENIGQYIGRD